MDSVNSLQHPSDDLEAIDLEVGRLAMLCGVSLWQPGAIEAIFRDDESVCLVCNPIAWAKLRGLLILHYHVVARSIEIDGHVMAAEYVRHSAAKVRDRLQPRYL
jgi:hypothetical protein